MTKKSQGRQAETKRKAPHSAFKKGQSGNPGGMTKDQAQARKEALAVLSQHGETLAKGLVRLAKKGNVVAAKAALEWILGKAPQSLELTGKGGKPLHPPPVANVSRLSYEQLTAIESILATATEPSEPGGDSSGEGPPPVG